VRRLITGLGLLLLVSAPPACLLYTDRINGAPTVAIVAPDAVFPGKDAAFAARVSDPDGDVVTLRWMRVERDCQKTTAEDWKGVAPVAMGQSYSMVPGQTAFCLHLVATDSSGAESMAAYAGNPRNSRPAVQLSVVDPAAADRYPLYTAFQLRATVVDPDRDPTTVTWKIRDGAGKDLTAAACAGGDPQVPSACFTAEHPGPLTVTATATDPGGQSDVATLTLPIAEDQPPCIEAADPAVDATEVVLALTDPPRRFEVRQVRDDGNPFPPGPRGGASFRWYTARETGEWTREIEYDRPVFEVSAARFARFEDPRLGTVYRVRVEVRDPAHDDQTALRDLEACEDRRICQSPPGCIRWLAWKVRLQ
jgi:hypothetical protein